MNKALTVYLSSAAIMASFLIGNEAVLTKQAQASLLNDVVKNIVGAKHLNKDFRPDVTCKARLPQCGYKPINQIIRPGQVRYPRPTHTTYPGHGLDPGFNAPTHICSLGCWGAGGDNLDRVGRPTPRPQPTHGYGGGGYGEGVMPIYHQNIAF